MGTEAKMIEAHREGLRHALEIYRSANQVFDEPDLQLAYLSGVARELRRLIRNKGVHND